MHRRLLSILLILGVIGALALPTTAAFAQRGGDPDRDGDGVPDSQDNCPDVAGIPRNNGCPVDDGGGRTDSSDDDSGGRGDSGGSDRASDPDSDGVVGDADQCPLEPGPVRNNGCPTAEGRTDSADTSDQPLPELPRFDAEGRCMAATQGHTAVRIRAVPGLDGDVIGAMDPYETYAVAGLVTRRGENWLQLGSGYAAQSVTRLGGNCAGLWEVAWPDDAVEPIVALEPLITDETGPSPFVEPLIPPGMHPSDRPLATFSCDGSVHVALFGDGRAPTGEECMTMMADGRVVEFGSGLPFDVPDSAPRVDLPDSDSAFGIIIVGGKVGQDAGEVLTEEVGVVFHTISWETEGDASNLWQGQIADDFLSSDGVFVIGGFGVDGDGAVIVGAEGIVIINNGYGGPDSAFAFFRTHETQASKLAIVDDGEKGIIIINSYGGPDTDAYGIVIINSLVGITDDTSLGEVLSEDLWETPVW